MVKTKNERKVLDKISKLQGKIKCIHNNYLGRRQTISIMKIENKYYMGCALCGVKDNFSRKVGRSISIGRAWLNYEDKNIQHSMPEEFKFREDQVEVK